MQIPKETVEIISDYTSKLQHIEKDILIALYK